MSIELLFRGSVSIGYSGTHYLMFVQDCQSKEVAIVRQNREVWKNTLKGLVFQFTESDLREKNKR